MIEKIVRFFVWYWKIVVYLLYTKHGIMSYHNYHARNLQRIENGEYTRHEFVQEYNKISPCLLLYFKTHPYVRPIREHAYGKYEFLTKTP